MKSVRDVRIVAVLFLIAGVTTVVRLIQTRMLELTPGLLGIPTGIGLLRWNNGWRLVAVATLWIALTLCVVVGGLGLISGETVMVSSWSSSPVVIAIIAIIGLALTVWEIRVLTRPNVRRSFELGDPAA